MTWKKRYYSDGETFNHLLTTLGTPKIHYMKMSTKYRDGYKILIKLNFNK